jgi:hypothetical protein
VIAGTVNTHTDHLFAHPAFGSDIRTLGARLWNKIPLELRTSIPFKGMVGNDFMLFLHGYTPGLPDSWSSGSAPANEASSKTSRVRKKIDTVHFYP